MRFFYFRKVRPYEFKVVTSSMAKSSTTSNVFVQLMGPTRELSSRARLKGNFQQGSTELVQANLEDVGFPLQALRISHDNTGAHPNWHLDRVEVRQIDQDYEVNC